MAITVKENTGTSFGEGWKQVTISTAKRGDYNGSGFIDLWFDNYPETLKCRVWEARGQDGQEFSVSNMVRSSNPDVLESSEGEDGKKIASLKSAPDKFVPDKLVPEKSVPFRLKPDKFDPDRFASLRLLFSKLTNSG